MHSGHHKREFHFHSGLGGGLLPVLGYNDPFGKIPSASMKGRLLPFLEEAGPEPRVQCAMDTWLLQFPQLGEGFPSAAAIQCVDLGVGCSLASTERC